MACVISSVVLLITGSITLLSVSECESWGDLQSKKSECNAKHLSSWTVCSSLEQC